MPLDQQNALLNGVTHIFEYKDSKYSRLMPSEIQFLKKTNIYRITLLYLMEYILNENLPNVNDFLF